MSQREECPALPSPISGGIVDRNFLTLVAHFICKFMLSLLLFSFSAAPVLLLKASGTDFKDNFCPKIGLLFQISI